MIPDGKTDLRAVWKGLPAFGRVKAIARIVTAINKRPAGTFTSNSTTLTLLPLLRGAIVLAAITLICVIVLASRRRRQAWRTRRKEERELVRAQRAGEVARPGSPVGR